MKHFSGPQLQWGLRQACRSLKAGLGICWLDKWRVGQRVKSDKCLGIIKWKDGHHKGFPVGVDRSTNSKTKPATTTVTVPPEQRRPTHTRHRIIIKLGTMGTKGSVTYLQIKFDARCFIILRRARVYYNISMPLRECMARFGTRQGQSV
jgi:hypothetical protein